MGRMFYPDECAESAYIVDYEKMYVKGFRGIIFDIDNTLVLPDAPADERSIALFRRLRNIGFSTVILSNNKGVRIRTFAEAVGSPYLTGAIKPFPEKYREAVRMMAISEDRAFFIGDQIYTDIWGANNAGIHSILTRPFTTKEEIQIVIKRILEKPVLSGLRRKGMMV